MPSDTSNSGIYILEGPARGQPIPVDGDSLTAFIGPTPRGPVDHAVTIESLDDFLRTFATPECHCRMENLLRQFFANGGRRAVVVRVSGTRERNRIHLPAADGELVLAARNPGPMEYLRASVDYDGIEPENTHAFNLVIQRLRSAGSAWIDAQEYYRRVNVDESSRDYVGYLLSQSDLATLVGSPPASRPNPTYKTATVRQAGYVDTRPGCVLSPPPGDYDLVGSVGEGTGLSALEHIDDIGQLIVLSGSAEQQLGPVVLLAADQFCRNRQATLLIEPPAHWRSVSDVMRDVQDPQSAGFASPNALTWYPGVFTRNLQGEQQPGSAAGAIAAALVAEDRSVRSLQTQGPVILRGANRLTARVEDGDVARLAKLGVNSLVRRSALQLQLLGNVTQARYGSIASDWSQLDTRRRVLFVLRRIRSGTRWTFFSESGPDTWSELTEQVDTFMRELHRRGLLAGSDPRQAWYVRCDADTNAGLEGRLGQVAFLVGFALRRPGEFLAFRFQRAQGGCKITELGWQPEHLSGLQQAG